MNVKIQLPALILACDMDLTGSVVLTGVVIAGVLVGLCWLASRWLSP